MKESIVLSVPRSNMWGSEWEGGWEREYGEECRLKRW